MAALIGALRVSLSADTAKFEEGMRRADRQAVQSAVKIEKSLAGVRAGLTGFASALSVGLLAGVIKKALDYAGSLGEVAQQLGVTTKELQTFRFVAQQNGATLEQADIALGRFAISTSKAMSGSKQAAEAFRSVGVSLEDLKNKSKTEIIGQIADQMIKQGGAARNAAAGVAIFGKGFLSLVPTLDQGSQGINQLSAAAEKLGIVLSDQQIQQADQTADKLEAVKTVLAAQIAGVVTQNANAILNLASALGTLTGSILNFLNSNPTAALGILGALAGGKIGGLPGAAIGGLAGSLIGSQRKGQPFNPSDKASISLLTHNLRVANDKLKKMQPGQERATQRDQVIALTKRLNSALGNTPAPTINTAAPPEFLAGAPKKLKTPKAAKAKKGPEDRSEDVEFQFAQELRQAQMEVLRARQSLAGTAEQRTALELEMLALDKQMRDAEIAERVRRAERDFADGKITESALAEVKVQAEKLQAASNETFAIQERAVLQEKQLHDLERADQLQQRSYENQLDDLRFRDEMATTQAEHRDLQLQIVDTLYKQKEAHLRALKAELELAGKIEEAADVQAEIDQLPVDQSRDTERAKRNTMNPLESWADSIPDTADEIIEQFQRIQAEGLDRLSDSIADVVLGTKSLKEAAHDMAAQFIADTIRMISRMLILKAITAAFGSFGTPVPGGDIASSGIYPDLGFASGGSFTVTGRSGTDRNIMSINGLPIARVSQGERVNVGNDNDSTGMGQVSLTFHNDFRGADQSAVAAIRARLDRMQAELPSTIVGTVQDAKQRFIIR